MDFLAKIEEVKRRLAGWQEEWGDEFTYIAEDCATEDTETGEENVYLGKHEHRAILEYLASKGYLEIIPKKGVSVGIKILPKAEPSIRLKTLEHIAQELKNRYTGTEIIDLLKEAGVNPQLIIYPQSKWLIFYGVFKELALSKDEKDRDLLFKVIAKAIHPLNFPNSGRETSEELKEKFNKYLEYDELGLSYSEEDKEYFIGRHLTDEEEMEIMQESAEVHAQEAKEAREYLQKPENKEKISTLRKAYQTLMNIVEVFCENPTQPTQELNDAYLQTKKLVSVDTALLRFNLLAIKQHTTHFSIPFTNLFAAEKDYKSKGKKLHWDEIRPEMYATYGEIEEIYQLANGSDILAAPDVQQTLNDVSLLLSKTKEENKKRVAAKQKAAMPQMPVQKIEITAMPDLRVTNAEDNVIAKGKKRVRLPHFNPTDWGKVTIRFIDEQNVILIADKKQASSDYDALGFADDKRGKPNTAWAFLLGLARNNAETKPLATPIPDSVKQHKRQLADRLKTIFKNDTDPFFDPAETRTYRIKLTLIPPQAERESLFEPQELLTEE